MQQLADKIRAAGHVTAEDVQSCVENFRVDDDALILKVRDTVSVARRKLLPRGFALMTPRVVVPAACALLLPAQMIAAWLSAYDAASRTPRVVVPAVWLHALTHPMCELRCASCARSRSLHVHAPGVRARPPGMWCVQQARPRQKLL